MAGHILTIEDPIEFLFNNKKSIVNQREVGRDTQSLQIALKNALRQAPDCILIGEIRDRETMTAAISYALSGHLVLVHAARQQQLPRARPHPVVLHARGAARRCWPTWPPACERSSRSACCAPPPAAACRRSRCCSTPSWSPS